MGKQIRSEGTITNLFIKVKHGEAMQAVETLSTVEGKGIEGDQAFGRRSRQVLLIDLDQLEALNVQPGDLRENITVSGLPLDSFPPGSKLKSGQVLLKIVDLCDPCEKLEEIRPGLMQAADGIRGMLAIVEKGGKLQIGDPISVLGPRLT
ncbi:MAG: MOSC domain-containing protein [Anaerolineales bacterium]|jgi:MOSC domain-containing protein YiiM